MALKTWLAALMAIVLTALTHAARAQDSADATLPRPAGPQWVTDDFLELGFRWDRHYYLLADPQKFASLQDDSFSLAGVYGWHTRKGKGIYAVTLNVGGTSSRGQLKTGEKLSSGVELFAPGFMFGQYLGKRLLVTEGFSLLTSRNGPGGQFDLAATIIISRWFAFRFGVSSGFYRTGLPIEDKRANMVGLGPTLEFIFVPWGAHRYEKKP